MWSKTNNHNNKIIYACKVLIEWRVTLDPEHVQLKLIGTLLGRV